MAKDFTHLHAIEARLFRERARLTDARTDAERAFRKVQVDAAERERKAELAFLGEPDPLDMSDEEMLAALGLD